MSGSREKLRALSLSVLLVLSVVAGTVAFSGAVAAATNTSISPSDDDAGASGVTYTADGYVELDNQDSLVYVDVHLGPADVSNVGSGDVQVWVDGTQYTDGLTEFSATDGTVAFKLQNSRSVSDGDRVRIVVSDVTNPSDDFIANTTLHDSGDAQWQAYTDSVSIDTPPSISYADLSVNETTVNVGEGLSISALINNTGEQNGTYNASFVVDGTVVRYNNGTIQSNSTLTTEFVESFAAPGDHNLSIGPLGTTEVTVTGPVGMVEGSADPSAVDADATVSNQRLFVDVANVSQDGNTDVHYVEFPNALAANLSVNSVDSNATSITSSPNLVEGYDDDGVTETVRFATSGDGGGDVNLNLTVDASVQYPDTETTYGIDARTVDSDGENATQADIVTVRTDDAPCVCTYEVNNPAGRDISVSFNTSEELSQIEAVVTNSSGTTVTTLTENDFTGTNESGTWVYDATDTAPRDGDYTVTLQRAVDDDGTDGASGESETVHINTVSVSIHDGAADPSQVAPGSTVNNQQVTVTLANVSADGDTDTHFVELPNALADNLSVNWASVNGTASIAQSAELVEGYDDDGVDETVRFQTDTDAGGTVPLDVTVDVSVTYPDTQTTYDVDARVADSDGDTAQVAGVASIQAAETQTPIITDFSAANPSGRNVAVTFNASEELADISVDVADGTGTTVATLTEADFSGTNQSGTWTYAATHTVASDGSYTATLNTAADADGNDGASGESDSVAVDSTPPAIDGGSASPAQIVAGDTVDNQQVHVVLDDVSADGDTDVHYVEFPDALAGNISVNAANANATAITSSANLVEGYDDDSVDDTVRFATSATGGGDVPLNVSVDVSIDYPTAETTYAVDARLADSAGTTVETTGVASIEAVGSQTPTISNYAVSNPSARELQVSFDASRELADISVAVTDGTGTTVATLTEADFSGTNQSGTWTYTATHTVASDGDYTATLNTAADDQGNDGAAGQSDSVAVDSTPASIVDGAASPAQVSPGETVNNQRVFVDLAEVSADGDTDVHLVEFPNALAANLSVNAANANATAITSSANLVEGYDDDGVTDTVRFATSATGGGDVALNVSVDVAVSPYPSGDASYAVDSRLVDSDAGALTQSNVTTIQAGSSDGGGGDDDSNAGYNPPEDSDGSDGSDGTTGGTTEPTAPPAPTVTNFDLTADGQDVDVTVTTTATVSELVVEVEGAVDRNLTRSAFTYAIEGDRYVYAANVSAGTTGTIEASLVTAANESGDGAAGQRDSVTVEPVGATETSAAAEPPWTGNRSTHTFTVGVPADASVTDETLSSVRVDYGEAFLNASGSVSSVSDDQNVVTLAVADANGTVVSRMGATDAVSVNVVDGEVRLDLSDVDSSRIPTLAAGDRLTVAIRPVTNPATAGDYRTDVELEDSAGDTTVRTASLAITGQPEAEDVATEVVGPEDERATLNLSESSVVETVAVESDVNATGVVSVAVPDERPAPVQEAPGEVLTSINVTRPDAVEADPVSLTLTVSADAIDPEASNFTVARYDNATDQWVQLDTAVVERTDTTVTLRANASHTSLFAVSAVEDTSDQQTTEDTPTDDEPTDDTPTDDTPTGDTGTSTPADTADGTPVETADGTAAPTDSPAATTTASGPGFGTVVAVLAMLGAALLALRRRS